MIEQVQEAGTRKWHGDKLLLLQGEPLAAIQQFFESLGSHVISGCEVTPNVSNWDIATGLIAIEHADGFKVVRTPAVVDVALPGYFTCNKTTVTGPYKTGGNKNISHEYVAVWNDGTGGPSDDTVVRIYSDAQSSDNQTTNFAKALGQKALSPEYTLTPTLFTPTPGELKLRANYLGQTVHIKGTINVKSYGGLNEELQELSNLAVPEYLRPQQHQMFIGTIVPTTSSYLGLDAQSRDDLNTVLFYLQTDGKVKIQFKKPLSGLDYTITVNSVVSLI